jgi:hypothetical protein
MLDIGEDRGALVVYTSEDLLGEEIEIRPHDGVWTGLHTAVRARHMGELVRYAGVFGSLPAGLYDLRVRHSHAAHSHAGHSEAEHAETGVHSEIASEVQTVSVKSGSVVETTFR